jgi:hypothetical protein
MHQDGFGIGLSALGFLFVFLSAWIGWFFIARIPVYAISRDYQITGKGSIKVIFSETDLPKILPGQPAQFSLTQSPGNPALTLEAKVMDIPSGGSKTVEIFVFTTAEHPKLEQTAGAEVKIEVESVSPATLVLRSTQKKPATP